MRRLVVCLTVTLLAMFPSLAGAAIVTFQDTTTAPGDTITYTLNFSGVPSGTATLTVSNSADVSPEVFAGAIVFKMDDGTPATLSLTTSPATWLVSDGVTNTNQNVIGGGGSLNQSVRQDGFSGFFSTAVASTPGTFTGLICVTCTPGVDATFTFSYTGATTAGTTPPMPLQVIYYNGTTSPNFDTILSVSFGAGTSVPEPATLLLLGCALAGVAGAARWGRRSN